MDATRRRPRDLRLDVFRGLAMLIILSAHIPWNGWALWIPARFGFSDATEIFVFCSGFASALAFGGLYLKAGWALGTVRTIYRAWQVYWAQIGMVLAAFAVLTLIDWSGAGLAGKVYVEAVPTGEIAARPSEALVGLLTLTWVPNYFDILPMYLVILLMIPGVMALHRAGGGPAVALVLGAVWVAAQTGALDLPARPWEPGVAWFFNPFGWQIVFFTGFAFGMGWIPAPAVRPGLVALAAAILLLALPFAWFRIHEGFWLPHDWALRVRIAELRALAEPLWAKSPQGALRYLHFLALAYLAWAAVGPGGALLRTGWPAPPRPAGRVLRVAAAVFASALLVLLAVRAGSAAGLNAAAWAEPWAEVTLLLGGLEIRLPHERISMAETALVLSGLVLGWAAAGPAARAFLGGPAFRRTVAIVRTVGTQSLAVFMASMVLAQVLGFLLDVAGRNLATMALANIGGFAVLIALAYMTAWMKSEPWRGAAAGPNPGGAAQGALAARAAE